jgi:tRNA G37 N-methylase Trm5
MAAARRKKPASTDSAQKKKLAEYASQITTLEEKIKQVRAVLADTSDVPDMFRVRDALEVLKG